MSKTVNETRYEARIALHAEIMRTQNLTSGRWAVAVVGRQEWMRRSAIGDGVTSATMSLVTRCETKQEAEELADRLNDLEPGVMPQSGSSAWIFEAVPYKKTDYISGQNVRRSQTRDCDRQIARL